MFSGPIEDSVIPWGPLATGCWGNLTQAPHPASGVLLLYRANIFYCQECNSRGCVLNSSTSQMSTTHSRSWEYAELKIWVPVLDLLDDHTRRLAMCWHPGVTMPLWHHTWHGPSPAQMVTSRHHDVIHCFVTPENIVWCEDYNRCAVFGH